jgi:hypothetical protein
MKQSLDGSAHAWQQKRVGEIFQARPQKIPDGSRLTKTAIQQSLGKQRRNFELRGQLTGEQRLRRRERPVELHFCSTTDEHRYTGIENKNR